MLPLNLESCLIFKISQYFLQNKGLKKINLDIVAHSMGFAYAQGMIEKLKNSIYKDKINWTDYYIIAAENACSGTLDGVWANAQVWQYGSNLGQKGADPIYEQDGVAPQCAVGGIGNRRAFIPATIEKDFLKSHKIEYYPWIFKIVYGKEGYVKKR